MSLCTVCTLHMNLGGGGEHHYNTKCSVWIDTDQDSINKIPYSVRGAIVGDNQLYWKSPFVFDAGIS